METPDIKIPYRFSGVRAPPLRSLRSKSARSVNSRRIRAEMGDTVVGIGTIAGELSGSNRPRLGL